MPILSYFSLFLLLLVLGLLQVLRLWLILLLLLLLFFVFLFSRSTYMFGCLSVYLPFCLYVHLFVCPRMSLSYPIFIIHTFSDFFLISPLCFILFFLDIHFPSSFLSSFTPLLTSSFIEILLHSSYLKQTSFPLSLALPPSLPLPSLLVLLIGVLPYPSANNCT